MVGGEATGTGGAACRWQLVDGGGMAGEDGLHLARPSPDEHLAVLVPGKLVHIKEFVLEEPQRSVVQLELHLEGRIGHTAHAGAAGR